MSVDDTVWVPVLDMPWYREQPRPDVLATVGLELPTVIRMAVETALGVAGPEVWAVCKFVRRNAHTLPLRERLALADRIDAHLEGGPVADADLEQWVLTAWSLRSRDDRVGVA